MKMKIFAVVLIISAFMLAGCNAKGKSESFGNQLGNAAKNVQKAAKEGYKDGKKGVKELTD